MSNQVLPFKTNGMFKMLCFSIPKPKAPNGVEPEFLAITQIGMNEGQRVKVSCNPRRDNNSILDVEMLCPVWDVSNVKESVKKFSKEHAA